MTTEKNLVGVSNRVNALYSRSGNRSSNPFIAIRALVQKLLREYGHSGPPFLPHRFCEMTSVKVRFVNLDGCDARLLPTRDGYIAEIQKLQAKTRQNFSICHEIAHTFFFPENGETFWDSTACSDRAAYRLEERVCNFAAAELLMPAQSLADTTSRHRPSVEALSEIASLYGASFHATVFRIINLNLWPCTYVRIRPVTDFDGTRRFIMKRPRVSQQATKGMNLVSRLKMELENRSERYGLAEVVNTGVTTTVQVSADDDESWIHFRRFYQGDEDSYIVGLAFHRALH
jgi:Zn-dependent peptidase ImmA (M78 family)